MTQEVDVDDFWTSRLIWKFIKIECLPSHPLSYYLSLYLPFLFLSQFLLSLSYSFSSIYLYLPFDLLFFYLSSSLSIPISFFLFLSLSFPPFFPDSILSHSLSLSFSYSFSFLTLSFFPIFLSHTLSLSRFLSLSLSIPFSLLPHLLLSIFCLSHSKMIFTTRVPLIGQSGSSLLVTQL